MKRAILLSGGIDSIALSYWLRPDLAFTIDYGQLPYQGEVRAAEQIAKHLEITHELLKVDCGAIGSGDLSGKAPDPQAPASEWWPYRNQLLLTICASKAITMGATEIMIGTVASDGFHKDGTPRFIELMNEAFSYQEGNLQISAPAITMTSAELVRASQIPEELLFWAHSCHKADYACGNCRGCNKYRNVMHELYGTSFTTG
ncbi:7-cyano-7-deazaguanine synthase [Hymenobacter sp. PAMC 26628]|uniref:7-cyano-7-deazaguanine synthase n=1 Tax=Hymenobacter sp. PAMC 26628 TaxID=1484118 RepID=UPI0007702FF8|nr:7-cyano-7-deazaguanine synthase [Hymenobacter sp. PAMC 26628]AMJ65931.1 7-cyano-7-deazaguanine synthase [Hymenobacter sp. PAMC 26628]